MHRKQNIRRNQPYCAVFWVSIELQPFQT